MAGYDALKAQWPNTAGADAASKLVTLNAMTVAGPDRPVLIADVMTYLRENNLWLPIKAQAGTLPAAAAAVDIAEDLRMQSIDFNLPIVGAMLNALVAATLLSQDQANTLTAMKATTLPWWQANGYEQPIGTADLTLAGLS